MANRVGDQSYVADHACLRILGLASKIEPDPVRLWNWFHHDAIAELDHHTARSLVDAGHGQLLERFLASILAGNRD